MKNIFLFILFLSAFGFGKAQISNVIPSSTSIANTSVANTRDWIAFDNPATMGYLEFPEFGMQFESRYFISELSTKSIQLALPTQLVNTGLSFSHFGYSQYHEILLGVGFARNFEDKFAMGVQFNYYTAFIAASNSYRGAFLPQLGLSVKLSPNFNLGFQSFNPFQQNVQTELSVKRLPSIFSLGTEYFLSPELIWRTQFDKELSSNYRLASGFDYQMLEQVSIKLGAYGSDYLIPCLGVGFRMGNFRVLLNCELHPLLGLNTIAGINYRFASGN